MRVDAARVNGDGHDLDAGDFSTWLTNMRAALRGEREADVPCDGCTACCTSSQFVHIGPDETDTLAHIPPELLFPAPRLPPGVRGPNRAEGDVLLGYDERGHCPMLVDGRCSIYEHRPRTCRTYDCRVFAAAGVAPDEGDPPKVLIARRTSRWRFTYRTEDGRTQHEAVRTAAAGLRADKRLGNTQRAVRAVESSPEA